MLVIYVLKRSSVGFSGTWWSGAGLQPSKHPSYTNKNITMNIITFLTPNPPKSYKLNL